MSPDEKKLVHVSVLAELLQEVTRTLPEGIPVTVKEGIMQNAEAILAWCKLVFAYNKTPQKGK